MSLKQLTKFKIKDIKSLYKSCVKKIDFDGLFIKIGNSQFFNQKMLIVTPKQVGNAVCRNYLRRICKNIYRDNKSIFTKHDIIVFFKKTKKKINYEFMSNCMKDLSIIIP